MTYVLDGLEPRLLWHHFYALSQIPRCSKHEDQVRQYVLDLARKLGKQYRIDSTGNVVIEIPAVPGCEGGPTVVVQAHLDMVCEKNTKTPHDFMRDALRLKTEGDWVTAEGTTLGADNGIGVAACLALLESEDVKHGPLELLLTVDEETGLTGAIGLDPGLVQGRMMINTDSEEDGVLFIGCAGGRDTELFLPVETGPVSADTAVRLYVGGLKGGHSGIEIHKGRGNAIQLLARFLWQEASVTGLQVSRLEGGNKRNAIPRECDALVCVPSKNLAALKSAVSAYEKTLKEEYGPVEPELFFVVEEKDVKPPNMVFSPDFQERFLNLVFSLPNGVMAMSHDIPGLVQTSTNLGIVEMAGARIRMATSQRSSVPSQLTAMADRVCAHGALAGAEVRHGEGYPGWRPNLDSSLLKSARGAYEELFGTAPEIKTIHAGLECGIIGDKFPGMDLISFGPTIEGAHSPSERVQISTAVKFWDLLVVLLSELAGGKV